MRYGKTEWGLSLKMYTQRYGITLKQVAAAAEVPYPTLLQVIIGKTPGYNVVPKVDAFVADYVAKNDPTMNMAVRPFEEVNLCKQPAQTERQTSETPRSSANSAPCTSRT